MKRILTVIFFIWATTSSAQKYFSGTYDPFKSWEFFRGVLDYSNNAISLYGGTVNVTDNTNPDSLRYYGAFIMNTDTIGNGIITKLFASKLKNYFVKLSFKENGDRYLVIGIQDTIDNFDYILYKLTNGNKDTTRVSNIVFPANVDGGFYYLNSKIYFVGIGETNLGFNNKSPLTIACISLSGEVKWFKKFPDQWCRIISVCQIRNGNFLLGGRKHFISSSTLDSNVGWYANVDSLGNILWDRTLSAYNKGTFLADYALITNCNEQILLVGSNGGYGLSQVPDSSYSFIAEIDSVGLVKWRKNFMYAATNRLICAPQAPPIIKTGALYFPISLETPEGINHYTQYAVLTKLDINGNLIWSRRFRKWYQDNMLWSINDVGDGFLLSGYAKDSSKTTGYQDAWLVKTDTNGCIVPGCNAHDGMVQITNPEAFMEVYPNPANEDIQLKITDDRVHLHAIDWYGLDGTLLTTYYESQLNELKKDEHLYNLSTTMFKEGYYFMVMELEDGSRAVRKVLIAK